VRAGERAAGSHGGGESRRAGLIVDTHANGGEAVGVARQCAGDDTRAWETRPCPRLNRSDFSHHPARVSRFMTGWDM
jgi:hypothetical protein